jgi:hypothetical protein
VVGDVRIPKPPPNRVGAKVQELIESGHELYATAVTGAPSGRVRRPTLYAITAIGIVITLAIDGPVGLVAGGVALIAMLLLAMSDAVVEL